MFLDGTSPRPRALGHRAVTCAGEGVRESARRLRRSTSMISRGLCRNASTRTYRLAYKGLTAQWHAERCARRPRVAEMVTNGRLREYVQDRLSCEVHTATGKSWVALIAHTPANVGSCHCRYRGWPKRLKEVADRKFVGPWESQCCCQATRDRAAGQGSW